MERNEAATLRVVTMRVDSARLLIDNEKEWTEIGNKGLVFHISFFQSATVDGMKRAVRKLLRLPLMSRGKWGDEQFPPESIIQLCGSRVSVDVLIVPQANLTGQPSSSSNTIRYTNQLEKEEAREMYRLFCEEMTIASKEALHTTKKKKTAAELDAERLEKEAKNSQDPSLTFQTGDFAGKYSIYDDRGVPTHDATGNPLSKAATKKCEKIYKARCEKYKKSLARKNNNVNHDNDNNKSKNPTDTSLSHNVSKLKVNTSDTIPGNQEFPSNSMSTDSDASVPLIPNISFGIFGNRQGFECISSGPTIHCFDL